MVSSKSSQYACHPASQSPCPKGNSGFSLIEVSIALLVISILMSSMIALYNVYAIQKQQNDTKNRITIVQSALSRYLEYNGYYPRPADRNIRVGTAGFGKEAAVPTTACTVSTDTSCLATGGTVYIGDVPFAALGITYKNIVDPYGSKLTYAVTAAQTVPGGFLNNAGAIQVVLADNSNQFTGTNPLAHFFVFSSGPDRVGTYSLEGNIIAPCGTLATNGLDAENCNGDSTFRSNFENRTGINFRESVGKYVRNFTPGANNFDDFSGYQNTFSSGLWSVLPNTGDLTNTNGGGNILIGGQTILATGCNGLTPPGNNCIVPPQTKIQVIGSVRATELRANRLCEYNIAGCTNIAAMADQTLSPLHFAGTPNNSGVYNTTTKGNKGGGILCPNKSALNGFSYSTSTLQVDERCVDDMPIAADDVTRLKLNGNCAANTYASGIDAAGAIVCTP